MNPASSNLLTSYRMISRLSSAYLLSVCLISLCVRSMPNLSSITSLRISVISDICHVKTSRFFQRKVMSMSSYLTSRPVLIRSFLPGLLGSSGASLSSVSFFFTSTGWSAGCWLDVEVSYVPFLAHEGWWEPIISGLGAVTWMMCYCRTSLLSWPPDPELLFH
jgi:hypothetical protein